MLQRVVALAAYLTARTQQLPICAEREGIAFALNAHKDGHMPCGQSTIYPFSTPWAEMGIGAAFHLDDSPRREPRVRHRNDGRSSQRAAIAEGVVVLDRHRPRVSVRLDDAAHAELSIYSWEWPTHPWCTAKQ